MKILVALLLLVLASTQYACKTLVAGGARTQLGALACPARG